MGFLYTPPEKKYVPADYGRRLVAFLADLVFAAVVIAVVAAVTGDYTMTVRTVGDRVDFNYSVGILSIPSLTVAAVFVLGWWTKQSSPGKRLMHLHLVTADTFGRPSLIACALRYLGYAVSIALLFLPFLWPVFDRNKQAWYDKILNLHVVSVEKVPVEEDAAASGRLPQPDAPAPAPP